MNQLGPSPSGPHRVAFYRLLMQRNVASILRKLHPATMIAAQRFKNGLWNEIVEGFSREHPPAHFDPNRFGETLSDYLATLRQRDVTLPPYLEELADYQWLTYAVGVAPYPLSTTDVGLDRTLFVRQYDHSILRFVREAVENPAAALPEPTPQSLIIYRDPTTLRAKTFQPTALGLMALARRAGTQVSASGVTATMLDKAERELIEHGVLL